MRVLLPNGEVWFMTIEMMEGKKYVLACKVWPLPPFGGWPDPPVAKAERLDGRDPEELKENIDRLLSTWPRREVDLLEVRTYPRYGGLDL